MSNQTTPAECHPDRFRYRGELCKPCYFRKWRKDNKSSARSATSSATLTYISPPAAHDGNQFDHLVLREAIDKRLKELGIFPELIPGDGSWAKKLYDSAASPFAQPNPTENKEINVKLESGQTLHIYKNASQPKE